LAGVRPGICAAIVNSDLAAIKMIEPLVDFYELRIDLVGEGWRDLARRLEKPWLACNRRAEEGGNWRGGEPARIEELLKALELGAGIIDIELATPELAKVIKEVKGSAECLISHHNLKVTPPLKEMRDMIKRQIGAGADICKVVTTARSFGDNLTVLQLIRDFPQTRVVAFAMGAAGQISRVLCPLAGGYFIYASVEVGRESAEGQLTVKDLREIYGMLGND
jgi:3-dehydroquinate dehydratase-1